MSVTTTTVSPITLLHTVRSKEWPINQQKNLNLHRTLQFKPLCTHFRPSEKKLSITHGSRKKRASLICYSGAEQTQTITKQSPTSTITNAPIKSPDLDDGGDGFPPRDDGDGGGGGGGGGGGWSRGGFFFMGFLALLLFLKDSESEESPYEN